MSSPIDTLYRTKAGAAEEAIRSAIYDGRFPPGTRLVLRQLEVELCLSITPIREALQSLQVQGLIMQEPHKGFRVADLDAEAVDETYWLRGVLEPIAARLATARVTDVFVRQLELASRDMAAAAEEGRAFDMQRANRQFHMLIYEQAGNRKLLEHIRLLWKQSPYGSLRLVPKRQQQSVQEHAELIRAFKAGDATSVERAMFAHIEQARVGLRKTLFQATAVEPSEPATSTEG